MLYLCFIAPTGYCYGVVLYKASRATAINFLSVVLSHLSSNHSQFIHQSSLFWLQQRHLVAKRGESGLEIAAEFCQSASLIPQGFFNMPWNLMKWGRRLYFPFEGNRATDFIALEVHRSWPCLNLRTFGSSGKHDNNYITENDFITPRVDTHFSDFEQAIPYHQW
jgi:hypothetical protein